MTTSPWRVAAPWMQARYTPFAERTSVRTAASIGSETDVLIRHAEESQAPKLLLGHCHRSMWCRRLRGITACELSSTVQALSRHLASQTQGRLEQIVTMQSPKI